jgi:hypothetical protein
MHITEARCWRPEQDIGRVGSGTFVWIVEDAAKYLGRYSYKEVLADFMVDWGIGRGAAV